MPFEGAVRSRVASWLGPWLREQPDAEIELGFLRCQGTWRDLEFDPLKLDPFIEGSTGLAFKQVRVAELSVRFNPWSRPNLRVSITGFHVILVPRYVSHLILLHVFMVVTLLSRPVVMKFVSFLSIIY